MWEDDLSECQIGGWRAVSAAGWRGKAHHPHLHKRIMLQHVMLDIVNLQSRLTVHFVNMLFLGVWVLFLLLRSIRGNVDLLLLLAG